MEWVFLSPHFDDAVFSCGGLIWDRVQAGETVQIWTVCAGDIPHGRLSAFAEELHRRWGLGDAVISTRRDEDDLACARLKAVPFRLPVPDCIYRRVGDDCWNPPPPASQQGRAPSRHLYTTEAAIFGEIHPDEAALVERLSAELASQVPRGAELVCPLTVGGHVDHRLVRAAAENTHRPLWYYADVPYALHDAQAISRLIRQDWAGAAFPISAEGLDAWIDGAAAYVSQIPTFWQDKSSIRSSIGSFLEQEGGLWLWKAR